MWQSKLLHNITCPICLPQPKVNKVPTSMRIYSGDDFSVSENQGRWHHSSLRVRAEHVLGAPDSLEIQNDVIFLRLRGCNIRIRAFASQLISRPTKCDRYPSPFLGPEHRADW